jgi:hypothetical protein
LNKIGSAAKDLKLSIPTVTSALETLTKLRIARESTGPTETVCLPILGTYISSVKELSL